MELVYSVLAAIGLGALHSLEPGHGKSVISAYLIATRGKIRDALIMGILSAVTHTLSIVLLSLAASSLIQSLAPDKIADGVELAAGVLIACIGFHMMYRHFHPRVIVLGKWSQAGHAEVCEHHGHDHHGHHGHHHPAHEAPSSLFRMALISFLTGMIPCPSAMAIFLAALSNGSLHFGILLVLAFSLGGAVTMSAIGILIVHTGAAVKLLDKIQVVRSLNFASAFFILGIGLLVLLQSFGHFVS